MLYPYMFCAFGVHVRIFRPYQRAFRVPTLAYPLLPYSLISLSELLRQPGHQILTCLKIVLGLVQSYTSDECKMEMRSKLLCRMQHAFLRVRQI